MINSLLVIVSFCFSILTLGQQALPVLMDTNVLKGEFLSSGVFEYGGTAVQNQFSKKILFGGFIDSEIKDASFAKHKRNNILGIETNSELEYRNYLGTKLLKGKYGFYVRGAYSGFGSMAYSNDLFGMIFYGNKKYMGSEANFSGTDMNGLVFQKLGFGLIDKHSKTNFGINFYNISQYGAAYVQQGEITTDTSGNSILLDLNTKFQYATGKKFNKGWGLGLDGDFRIKAAWIKDRTAFFQVQFKNIGLMQVNQVELYQIDTTQTYNGLKFSQLYGENSLDFSNSAEILDSLGVRKLTHSFNAFLPGLIQISKLVDEHSVQKVQSFFGVRLYTNLAYIPMVFAGAQLQVYPWMKIGLQTMYGGFSKFRFGFYSQYRYKKAHFGIGSDNLVGVFSKLGYGESIYLRLTVQW